MITGIILRTENEIRLNFYEERNEKKNEIIENRYR